MDSTSSPDLNHRFIHGTWEEYNNNFEAIPIGSITFCDDVGKIMMKVDESTGLPFDSISIEEVNKVEE